MAAGRQKQKNALKCSRAHTGFSDQFSGTQSWFSSTRTPHKFAVKRLNRRLCVILKTNDVFEKWLMPPLPNKNGPNQSKNQWLSLLSNTINVLLHLFLAFLNMVRLEWLQSDTWFTVMPWVNTIMNIKAIFWNKGIPGQNRQFEDDFSKFSRNTFEIPGFPSSVELPVAVNERIAEGKIVF